jgi:hypothetical protein
VWCALTAGRVGAHNAPEATTESPTPGSYVKQADGRERDCLRLLVIPLPPEPCKGRLHTSPEQCPMGAKISYREHF